ncbi:hypothetical protein PF010_g5556 [Phytophthora fragariae]|uniref:Uncharacterized protein n=1 Tax=Phytophthora fragariae TaxID=53985 RepID=A0A6G0LPC1_9STRA|nr:hypothetical protein PF010_g5556 [Phytophthora fragariae]
MLDHQIVDGAWVDNDTGFALLLANGQMSVGAVNDTGCIELLAISTPSTMSKRLSLSALLGKAVSAALQLVWVAQEKQLVVDFGTGCEESDGLERMRSGTSEIETYSLCTGSP